jgi:hypothetical protein
MAFAVLGRAEVGTANGDEPREAAIAREQPMDAVKRNGLRRVQFRWRHCASSGACGTAVRSIVATCAVVRCGTPHNLRYPPVKLAEDEVRLAT